MNRIKLHVGQIVAAKLSPDGLTFYGVVCHVAKKGPFVISAFCPSKLKDYSVEENLKIELQNGNYLLFRHGRQGFEDHTWTLTEWSSDLPSELKLVPYIKFDSEYYQEIDPQDLATVVSVHESIPANRTTISRTLPGHLHILHTLINLYKRNECG